MDPKYNPVGWFEIPANDLDRAKKFYEASFDIEMPIHEMGPSKMAWFPFEEKKVGAAGTLIKQDGYTPSHQGTLVYFSVKSIEETTQKVEKSGGKTLQPKMDIGDYGFIALFQDTEGNRFGVHSRK